MPEGDNVHAHAAELGERLIGTALTAVWSRGVDMRGLRGRHVTSTQAIGKNLVLAFDEGTAVRVHLGINGHWRSVARATPAQLGQAQLALVTETTTFLCKAREIEWTRARFANRSRAIARLGPDLLGDTPDLDAIVTRARQPEHAARPIGELLLNQSVAAGLGNVYKCELLFLHGLDPWTRVDAVDDDKLRAIYRDGVRWMRANVGRSRTTTADLSRGELPARGRGRFWVYGRWRRACHRCGESIRQRRQGPGLRPTYWCPRCQPSASGGPSQSASGAASI
ncbi:MAG: glycosylase/AP lyase, DNA-binding protein [Myxococcales bacterium]|nr:glycosylase/AP lyase, DNA-binding protein [Myxococcales bacterium]